MSAAPSSTRELSRRVLELAREKKARQVVMLDVSELISYASVMIIMSSTSERHTRALANHLLEELKKEKIRPLGQEGFQAGKWILLDYGDVVVHVMQKQERAFYDLDGLWHDARTMEISDVEN